MKQEITQKQLLEINKDQSDELLGWMINRGYYEVGEVHLTIGIMIEFLHESKDGPSCLDGIACCVDEPVDALWESVKEVLNKK